MASSSESIPIDTKSCASLRANVRAAQADRCAAMHTHKE